MDETTDFNDNLMNDCASNLFLHQGCQTDSIERMNSCCQTDLLRTTIDEFTVVEILKTDESLRSWTGVSSLLQFQKICEAVEYVLIKLRVDQSNFKLDAESRVLLALMKLKTNTSFVCLASLFKISKRTAVEYFFYMVDVLYTTLKPFIKWFSEDEAKNSLPIYFVMFPNTRVVVDCAEVPLKKNKCLNCSIRTYSHYKGTHTIKFMVGVTKCGAITFISKCYGGRASDKFIFNDSKVLEKLRPGDAVMADKGFSIEEECASMNIELYKPPVFSKFKKQFEPEEAETCRRIARARVHVERTIQRIRLYKILNERLDWLFLESIDKILSIVCALVNLSPSVLSDERF